MTSNGKEGSLRAKQGECLSGHSDNDLKRISCDSASARWSVVAVVENRTKEQAKQEACQAWPTAEASYWESRDGKTGFVLCLASMGAK
jgi:hypothetical protein